MRTLILTEIFMNVGSFWHNLLICMQDFIILSWFIASANSSSHLLQLPTERLSERIYQLQPIFFSMQLPYLESYNVTFFCLHSTQAWPDFGGPIFELSSCSNLNSKCDMQDRRISTTFFYFFCKFRILRVGYEWNTLGMVDYHLMENKWLDFGRLTLLVHLGVPYHLWWVHFLFSSRKNIIWMVVVRMVKLLPSYVLFSNINAMYQRLGRLNGDFGGGCCI